jgi:hypothetical protein
MSSHSLLLSPSEATFHLDLPSSKIVLFVSFVPTPSSIVIQIHTGQTGLLTQEILNAGYNISDMQMFHLDHANAEEFLEVYKGVVPEYHVMLNVI